jgi:hypothetical protein
MAGRYESRFHNHLLNQAPPEMQRLDGQSSRFFRATLFTMITTGSLSQLPLHPTIELKSFSLLHPMLLHPSVHQDDNSSPYFAKSGFESYEALEAVFQAVKWFLMSIYHANWYQHTILYKGICLLEKLCKDRNFRTYWRTPTFNKAAASYIIINCIHNLGAYLASLATNVPEDDFCHAFYSSDSDSDLHPCYIAPSSIKEAAFNSDLLKSLHIWLSPMETSFDYCNQAHASFMAIINQPFSINNHTMFRDLHDTAPRTPSNKRKNPPASDNEQRILGSPGGGKPRPGGALQKPEQAPHNQHILQPVSPLSINDLLEKAKEQRTKFLCKLPTGKTVRGIRPNCKFCLPYLLGNRCTSNDCGYHLALDSRMLANAKDWSFFRTYVKQLDQFVQFSDDAAAHVQFRTSPARP